LATITSTITDYRAVLVMTSRIEGDPIDPAWRSITRDSPFMTIDLAPLRNDEAIAFASEFIDVAAPFARRCVERAKGNPLFLEQLLRSAEETMQKSLPGSIQSIVLARMDSLDAVDKQALQAASVIGQRFSLDVLCRLIERPQYACTGLIEHFLVRPEGEDFLFAHALVREGVYSSLLKPRRCELHRKAAEWFAERDPILKAEHLDRAIDPAAAQAYLEAAEVQALEFRYERSRQLLERGLQLATDQAVKYDLTCSHGDILRYLGFNNESIAAFEDALNVADDDVKRCRAWVGMAAGMRVVDRSDEALEVLDRAKAAATDHDLIRDLAQIHHLRGNLYYPLGNIDSCLEEHGLARNYARQTASVEDEARALGGLGDAYYQRGRMITACKPFSECVQLSREHGFRRIEAANLSMVGFSRHYSNELREALELGLETIEAAAKIGHHRAELLGRMITLSILIDGTDLDATRDHLEQAKILAEHLGARRFEATYLRNKARVLRIEGRRANALELCERAAIICRDTGVGFAGPQVLAELALNTDDRTVRWQALQEGESMLNEGVVSHSHFHFYRDGMEACLVNGEWDEVDRYAIALQDFTRPEPLPWCDFFIARGRTLASYGRGNRDDATKQELGRLHDEAERIGLKLYLPALETALTVAS
jgi:tetratricopeptide (TPR) repeat protein